MRRYLVYRERGRVVAVASILEMDGLTMSRKDGGISTSHWIFYGVKARPGQSVAHSKWWRRIRRSNRRPMEEMLRAVHVARKGKS